MGPLELNYNLGPAAATTRLRRAGKPVLEWELRGRLEGGLGGEELEWEGRRKETPQP